MTTKPSNIGQWIGAVIAAVVIIGASFLGFHAFNAQAHANAELQSGAQSPQSDNTTQSGSQSGDTPQAAEPTPVDVPKPTPPPHLYAGGQIGAQATSQWYIDLWAYAFNTGDTEDFMKVCQVEGYCDAFAHDLERMHTDAGGVIGCKQFSCSGDAVWRLIMGCRRMLGAEDRAAIMAGLEAGLSQVCIAHLIGRSPSVVCREIARHTGPDGQYRAEEAGKAARAARRRPKKRLLDCDEVLRDRVIADLSQGHTPRQISGRLRAEACGTLPSMDTSPDAQGHTISHEAIYTWIYAHPKKTLIEHGICLPSRRWMRKKPPASGRKPPIVGMRLIDERPDISDRKIPGNWEGDLIIGQDGASACATLVERTTRYLIIVALPLGRKADQVCDALTRRIQGLPDGAMRTLTWDQGREMARHQRLTHDTGVEVFFAHPHSPWERGTNENTNRLIRRYLPKGTPITSHQPYLDAIAYELNNCPRATLGYRTPTEAFNELIATTH